MALQHRAHDVRMGRPQSGRALDVGKPEHRRCHCPNRNPPFDHSAHGHFSPGHHRLIDSRAVVVLNAAVFTEAIAVIAQHALGTSVQLATALVARRALRQFGEFAPDRISSGSASQRRVEPSIFVNRKVTVPDGRTTTPHYASTPTHRPRPPPRTPQGRVRARREPNTTEPRQQALGERLRAGMAANSDAPPCRSSRHSETCTRSRTSPG